MATQVQDLITMIRDRTDMTNDNFITDQALVTYINASAGELDDLLVQTYDDYKLSSTILSITSNNYCPLPADFYKPRGVEVFCNSPQPYSVRPFNFQERNRYANSPFVGALGPYNIRYRVQDGYFFIEPITSAIGVYTFWYTPAFASLTSASQYLPSYMDIQSWCEYITVDCCIKVKMKLELDFVSFESLKEPLRQRILIMNKGRSAAEGKTVSAIRGEFDELYGFTFGQNGNY